MMLGPGTVTNGGRTQISESCDRAQWGRAAEADLLGMWAVDEENLAMGSPEVTCSRFGKGRRCSQLV